QIIYMDKVPDSAAVNESVRLAKSLKLFKSSGFINGLLRSFLRNNKVIPTPPESDTDYYLSVKYSCPKYLVSLWREAYGDTLCESILKTLSGRPPLTVHTNTLLLTADELIKKLDKEGVKAEKSSVLPFMLSISHSGSVNSLETFKRGEFFVQDESSAICAELTGAKPHDTVFDVCSAPGGKTFAMAMMMENTGAVRAFDVHVHKIKLIESGAFRLKLKNIKPSVRDARLDEELTEKADIVLCDVPCSGFGIARRKPEIRYRKEENFESLPKLQYGILCNSAKLVKPGGTLQYSTCTLNPDENGKIAHKFLSEHTEFMPKELKLPSGIRREISEPLNQITFFPKENGGDGFFVAAFERCL
ncbi:MAG: 16S rRNA (cytosine(967)-C(5))-methyltransferase RsmB, partial [Eubacteriales bacterium]|nr:16S rRNA (cytosine(967)-C(5))-methyltransferase RsmB [Eubacteriales bacterium]